MPMKTYYTISITMCITMICAFYYTISLFEVEIYTPKNIYFIHGLSITSNTSDEVIHFESFAEMREYVGQLTANDAFLANKE